VFSLNRAPTPPSGRDNSVNSSQCLFATFDFAGVVLIHQAAPPLRFDCGPCGAPRILAITAASSVTRTGSATDRMTADRMINHSWKSNRLLRRHSATSALLMRDMLPKIDRSPEVCRKTRPPARKLVASRCRRAVSVFELLTTPANLCSIDARSRRLLMFSTAKSIDDDLHDPTKTP
jgi:hypothetical protein